MQPDAYLALLQKSNGQFTDVSDVELRLERVTDQGRLPVLEIAIPSTGGLCVDAPFAEPEVDRDPDGVGHTSLCALLRRREHPLDRRVAWRAVGAPA